MPASLPSVVFLFVQCIIPLIYLRISDRKSPGCLNILLSRINSSTPLTWSSSSPGCSLYLQMSSKTFEISLLYLYLKKLFHLAYEAVEFFSSPGGGFSGFSKDFGLRRLDPEHFIGDAVSAWCFFGCVIFPFSWRRFFWIFQKLWSSQIKLRSCHWSCRLWLV